MKKTFTAILLLSAPAAFAWDCSYWSQSTDPKAECYKAPGPLSIQTQTQQQSQQTAASASASANNAGNSQITNFSSPRQAPSIGQGSFAIQGCGVAGNAGGSQSSGAAFLGFAFTPQQCYDFMLAQAYASVGAERAACEVLNKSKAGRRAEKRGVVLPICSTPILPPASPPVSINVQPANCTEQTDRAFKQCVKK